MPATPNAVLSSLADPTRRAIFDRLMRDGELTVRALTDRAGVSQPAVSKHLRVLRLARLVRGRREGRETHYRARPEGLTPLIDWMSLYGVSVFCSHVGPLLRDGHLIQARGVAELVQIRLGPD